MHNRKRIGHRIDPRGTMVTIGTVVLFIDND